MIVHATVDAIRLLLDPTRTPQWAEPGWIPWHVAACDWKEKLGPQWVSLDAQLLVRGKSREGRMPTCGSCAVLVDLALEIGASAAP